MAWEGQMKKSTYNATTDAVTLMKNREEQRKGSQYDFNSFNGYSIVGINVNKIDSMKSAIDDYCDGIEKHLEQIEPLADANGAFKSEEVQKSVKEYLEKTKEYCINLVSQMRNFNKKLDDVKSTWNASTQEVARDILADKNNMNTGTHIEKN